MMILRILLQLKLDASVAATFSHRLAISFCSAHIFKINYLGPIPEYLQYRII